MSWQEINVGSDVNLFSIYEQKYGINSDFQKFQKQLYSDPRIQPSFQRMVRAVEIKPGDTILDIGINNGYEIGLIEKILGKDLISKTKLIGFDLAEDALRVAGEDFKIFKDWLFVKGNIADFNGRDIATSKEVVVLDGTIDTVIAMTSLQSTSLNQNFDSFLENLVKKLKSQTKLFIAIPNFHINREGEFQLGLFDASTKQVKLNDASEFSKKLTKYLTNQGFKVEIEGDLVIYLLFRR